jgi:hypothetical protein
MSEEFAASFSSVMQVCWSAYGAGLPSAAALLIGSIEVESGPSRIAKRSDGSAASSGGLDRDRGTGAKSMTLPSSPRPGSPVSADLI